MASNDRDRWLMKGIEAIDQAVHAGSLTVEAGRNIHRWLTEPQYAEFQNPVLNLVDAADFDELNRLFWERIPFGTGGRRGPMSEFGSATINDRTIAESAQGLAVHVQKCRTDASSPPQAAIAFDSRNRSLEFARRTACVLAANGFRVHFFPQPRSTPELSFAVRYLKCDSGVVISASHNPPADNGFKAYWSTGGQVLPPHDAGIIDCVDAATEIPTVDFDSAIEAGTISLVGDDVDQAYVNAVSELSLSPQRDISALYTPLHGVGETSVYRVVRQAGFDNVSIFELQRAQDGNFPNVPDHLPNPERFAVFGPAIHAARSTGVDLILASDPDADRMAVAVRRHPSWQAEPTIDSTDFVCLTGNQLGALLTDYVLDRRQKAGALSSANFIIETLVTTPLIADIGKSYGVEVVRDVLVGFKHIAGEIDARDARDFVFAAEESIGFMAGNYVRDKDAAIAALYVLELAAELKTRGQTLLDRLHELYLRHGYFLEETISTQCPGPTGQARIRQIMAAFRSGPPSVIGSCVWDSVRDFLQHEVRSLPSNRVVEQIPAPSGDLLIFTGQSHECHVSVAMRPSGTEPKIKFYYFLKTSLNPSLEAARQRAAETLAEVQSALELWMKEVTGP